MRFAFCYLTLALSGCSSFDQHFRASVSQIDVTASNTYSDSHSGVTDSSSAGLAFYLRDPSKDGFAK